MMESLSEEVLLLIFQNIEPLELISLSRVNRCWRRLALIPQLHRSINFHGKQHLSSGIICNYIGKFKHSIQELNLRDCYWIKGAILSRTLQNCRKLTFLNVLGCSVTKKTLCSLLKLNANLKTLAWSMSKRDLPHSDTCTSDRVFKGILLSFCSGLSEAFKGLDSLTIRLPCFYDTCFIVDQGIPIICSELHLKSFTLQWIDTSGRLSSSCPKLAIEGSEIQFQRREKGIIYDGYSIIGEARESIIHELESGTLRTFIVPTSHPLTNYRNHDICENFVKTVGNRSSIVNLKLGVLDLKDVDCLTAILSFQWQTLVYLNLSNLVITGHFLQAIATSSPNLEILNVQNCSGCFTPIHGLESLALFCPKMTELNLNGVHYDQTSQEESNSCIKVISKFTNLVSLSICTCVMNQVSSDHLDGAETSSKGRIVKGKKRVCHEQNLKNSQSRDDSVTKLLNSFFVLTQECRGITDFELWFPSFLDRETAYHRAFYPTVQTCDVRRGTFDSLLPIANWKHLQRLTLSVPFTQGGLKFLVTIAQNCSNLQFLSLANFNNLSHSGNIALLQQALSCCHQLRDFRFQQKGFRINESFLLSLRELKHLQRVCIIAKEGPLAVVPQTIISLFEKCQKLYYFSLFCEMTVKVSRIIMDSIKKRFSDIRPALIVVLVPFRQGDLHSRLLEERTSIPFVHINEMLLAESSVASSFK
ncbi:F-box/LRR-repeat protein 18-like [Stylophora pistillata]|uniref:F-box domain-containing protein n=1 Tax=Stylophora pistillata TaxID=50429 RepID=A0A2B4RP35_STYPI|nr:F-box/LRR-repeat protein 18-like [Stylophora pistillata]PFX18549.1 hypothetical protein AWC38_SpisGene17082 [Stylophora pistillata]